jgi:hypothetical protein
MVMVIKMSKVKPENNAKQESTTCECGLDELKSIIQGEVSVYKAIWDEVERQFADAPAETRIKIYSSIAPYIGDVVTLTATECLEEEEDSTPKKKKKKK